MKIRWFTLGLCGFLVGPILAGLGLISSALAAVPDLPVLTTAKQVRDLSPTEAEKGYPVTLRGVVTFFDVNTDDLFVQDASAGIYLSGAQGSQLGLKVGDSVEAQGLSGKGEFAPLIVRPQLRILGAGTLPTARPISIDQLNSGGEDSQWIEISGIVRSVFPASNYVTIEVAGGSARTQVELLGITPAEIPTNLVDAVVSAQGVCSIELNVHRQITGFKLRSPGPTHVTVVEPAPSDPYSLPTQPLGELLRFTPQGLSSHRIRVQGIVTRQRLGDSLFLRDATGATFVRTAQNTPVVPGDIVDVVGFPSIGGLLPYLQDASFRKIGVTNPPIPVSISAEEALDGSRDTYLVQIEGRLLNVTRRPDYQVLVLYESDQIFEAILEDQKGGKTLAGFSKDSLLRVTGVCVVKLDDARKPRAVEIALRTPSDVVFLAGPRYGMLEHGLMIAGVSSALILTVLGWVVLLRHRVRQQTNRIREHLEREAALEKHYRELFEQANDLVFSRDREGRLTAVNRAVERVLGYSREEILGKSVFELAAPEQRVRLREIHAKVLAGATDAVFAAVFLHKDGHPVTLEVSDRLVRQNGQSVSIEGIARDITEREQMAQTLQHTLSLLSATLESTADGILVVDRLGKIVSYNHTFVRMWRIPEAVLQTKDDTLLLNFVLEQLEDPQAFLEKVKALYANPSEDSYDVLEFKDERIFERFSHPQKIGEQTVGRVWSFRDVTGQKRAERAIYESEEKYRLVVENATESISVIDYEGRVIILNKAVAALLGGLPEQFIGKTVWELFPRHLADAQMEKIRGVIDSGQGFNEESAFIMPDGTKWFNINFQPVRGSDFLARSALLIARDITQRKEMENVLRKNRESLVLSQRIGKVGGWELDFISQTLHWSDEIYRLFGRQPGEFIPTREAFYNAVHPEDRELVKTAVENAVREGGVYGMDHRILLPDGSERVVHEQATVIIDTSGQTKLAGTVQDITERKQLEQQLRQAQKMEAIGQLAGGIAHDFNNILTVIQGHVSLLLGEGNWSDQTLDSLKQVDMAAVRAANLTRQLLAFSRRQMLQRRVLDLNEVISQMSKMLHRVIGEQISLQFNYASKLPPILADTGMMDQVLLNLAVNARDAMPKGGQLRISTSAVTIGVAQVTSHKEARPGNFTCFSVADTGCGMDKKILDRLFEPFFTTKEVGKGTGLGLATIYGIVKQHEGWIEVASEPGQGATFTVFLPVHAEPAPLVSEKTTSTRMVGGQESILVVEDEPALRLLIRSVLKRYGYHVREAANGVEALQVWEHDGGRFDMLITDMVMPAGMTGRELATKLIRQKAGLKVMYISGYSMDLVDNEFTRQAGFNFLQKPFHGEMLIKSVRTCLDAPV